MTLLSSRPLVHLQVCSGLGHGRFLDPFRYSILRVSNGSSYFDERRTAAPRAQLAKVFGRYLEFVCHLLRCPELCRFHARPLPRRGLLPPVALASRNYLRPGVLGAKAR